MPISFGDEDQFHTIVGDHTASLSNVGSSTRAVTPEPSSAASRCHRSQILANIALSAL